MSSSIFPAAVVISAKQNQSAVVYLDIDAIKSNINGCKKLLKLSSHEAETNIKYTRNIIEEELR